MNRNRVLIWAALMVCLTFPLLGQDEGSGAMEGSHEGSHMEGSHMEESSAEAVLVLDGLVPVSLVQGKDEQGSQDLAVGHKGHKYQFASADHKKAFQENLDKYAVQNGGYCPVAPVRMGREIEGKPSVFTVHEGRIYLFGHPDGKKAFIQNPSEFIKSPEMEGSGHEMEEGSGPM